MLRMYAVVAFYYCRSYSHRPAKYSLTSPLT